MNGAAIIPESTNSSAEGDTPAMRLVPQSWIDRAMQIESAADALVSSVNDAIQRAQEGSGRLYAANGLQMADRAVAVLEATFLPQEPFGRAAPADGQAEALRAEVRRWCDHVQRFENLRHGTDPDASPHILAGHARKLAEALTKSPSPTMSIPIEITPKLLGEVMQDTWDEICDDALAHPSDMKHGRGTQLTYSPNHWTSLIALRLTDRLASTRAST